MKRPVVLILCIVGAFFILISLPFFGIASLFYAASMNSIRGTIQTSGTVVTTCNGNTSTTCHPLVRFRTQSGENIQFASDFSSSLMHQGDTVPVSYHPQDPQDAVISSFTSLWLFPVLLGGIGGFLLLIAIIFFISALVSIFGKRSRTPAFAPFPAPSDSVMPTVPSVSMAPTVPLPPPDPPDSPYPYHDPMGYNPYRT